jgi:hypothetical protein
VSDAVTLDPADFDAIGVLSEVVLNLRRLAMIRRTDVIATISAPPGRHRLHIAARTGGHTVFTIRFDELTSSRRNVLAGALAKRGWDLDEDGEGATFRYPPGTEHTTVAFDALPLLTLGGVPPDIRIVTAQDATGAPVDLAP